MSDYQAKYIEGVVLAKKFEDRDSPFWRISLLEQEGYWASVHHVYVYVFKTEFFEMSSKIKNTDAISVFGTINKKKYFRGNAMKLITLSTCEKCGKTSSDAENDCIGCLKQPQERLMGD